MDTGTDDNTGYKKRAGDKLTYPRSFWSQLGLIMAYFTWNRNHQNHFDAIDNLWTAINRIQSMHTINGDKEATKEATDYASKRLINIPNNLLNNFEHYAVSNFKFSPGSTGITDANGDNKLTDKDYTDSPSMRQLSPLRRTRFLLDAKDYEMSESEHIKIKIAGFIRIEKEGGKVTDRPILQLDHLTFHNHLSRTMAKLDPVVGQIEAYISMELEKPDHRAEIDADLLGEILDNDTGII